MAILAQALCLIQTGHETLSSSLIILSIAMASSSRLWSHAARLGYAWRKTLRDPIFRQLKDAEVMLDLQAETLQRLGRHLRPLEDAPAASNLSRARDDVQAATKLLAALAAPVVPTLPMTAAPERATTLVLEELLPTSMEVAVQTVADSSVAVHVIPESVFEEPWSISLEYEMDLMMLSNNWISPAPL